MKQTNLLMRKLYEMAEYAPVQCSLSLQIPAKNIIIFQLILYRYGSPNPKTRANLSTCIWQSPEQARASRSGPEHTKAMGLAKIVYESYHVENYVLRKLKGQEGVTIIAFEQDKVGSGYYRFE